MVGQLAKRLLALTDILVETGDTGWANTTRASAKRITEYDYDLAEAWDEGQRSGLETGITIAEVVTGMKPLPFPEPEPNPYRKDKKHE